MPEPELRSLAETERREEGDARRDTPLGEARARFAVKFSPAGSPLRAKQRKKKKRIKGKQLQKETSLGSGSLMLKQ